MSALVDTAFSLALQSAGLGGDDFGLSGIVELAQVDLICSLALSPSLLKKTVHRLLLNFDL